jgi:hypothetical protein
MEDSPFSGLLQWASRRLELVFHRAESENSALFFDPGLDYVIGRIVHPDKIRLYFQKVFNYNTNSEHFDFEKFVIFTTGDEVHLSRYVEMLSNTPKPPRELTIVFVNRFSLTARQFLEAHAFLHRVNQFEQLGLPTWILDSDLATLELRNAFNDVLIEGGSVAVERISSLITSFPVRRRGGSTYFTNLYFVGHSALRIKERLPKNFYSQWTHLLIIDRGADPVTPFVTPFTYEAWVAEVLGINYGITVTKKTIPLLFASTDTVSMQTRNLTVPEASVFLNDISHQVTARLSDASDGIEKFRDAAKYSLWHYSLNDHMDCLNESLEPIRQDPLFQRNLRIESECLNGKHQSRLFIRESVALAKDWRLPVRLFALYLLTDPKPLADRSDLDEIRQMIIDRFGLEAMAALWSLEEAGIICEQRKYKNWAAVRHKWKLWAAEASCPGERPYGGYAPLVLRLLQKIGKNEWNDCHNALVDLGVPFAVQANRCPELKRIMVVFVGGITYGEVAALRLQKQDLRVEIDMMTTEVLSCKRVMDELAGKV